jgi:hypothetical protein
MGQANSGGLENRRVAADAGIGGLSTRMPGQGRAPDAGLSRSQLDVSSSELWATGLPPESRATVACHLRQRLTAVVDL